MATAKNVTVIPATFNPQTRRPMKQVTRRRVAGYARVSTDSDEQFTSYPLRRRKAGRFQKMSHGAAGSSFLTGKSAFHTVSSSVTARVRTVFRK